MYPQHALHIPFVEKVFSVSQDNKVEKWDFSSEDRTHKRCVSHECVAEQYYALNLPFFENFFLP